MAMLAIVIALAFMAPQADAAYSVKKVFSRFSANAGETLVTGDIVSIKDSDGEAYKADADDSALRPAIGVIGSKTGGDGVAVEIITSGILTGWSSLSEGLPGYISSTAGAVTQTVVSAYKQEIGTAISSTSYFFDFQPAWAAQEGRIFMPLAAAFIDGTGVMGNDGTTAPGLAETDDIPAIVYASSAETTKIQWTFELPDDYGSDLGFRLLISSGVADGTEQSIDWQLWINDDDLTFDAAAVDQDAVAGTSATLDASCELITLTIDATGEAAISAGDTITVDIWNASTSDGTLEIKKVEGYYTKAH